MHALLFGAAVHMDVLRSPRVSLDNPIRLFHKVQTMRLLNEELRSPEKTPLDDVILAVLALGTNEVETMANNIQEKAQSPFNSPLTSAQWLDVYGSVRNFYHSVSRSNVSQVMGHLKSNVPQTVGHWKRSAASAVRHWNSCAFLTTQCLPQDRPDNSHRRTYYSHAMFSRQERRLGEHRTSRIG